MDAFCLLAAYEQSVLGCPFDDDGDFVFVHPKHWPLNCYYLINLFVCCFRKDNDEKKKNVRLEVENQNKYEYFFAFRLKCKHS